MPIDVRGPDGTIYRVNTDDEEVARETVRRRLARDRQEGEARAQAAPQPQPTGPNRAQATEAARLAAQRQMRRNVVNPLGLGAPIEALANLARNPAQRRELANTARGAADMAQQIPGLDFGRLARDTATAVQEGVRNLPRTAQAIAGNLPQIAAEITGVPALFREEAAQRDMDMARIVGDRAAEQQAARRANTSTGEVSLALGAPLLLGSNPSVLRAGATAMALDAPFALSRGEGSLQERLPGALTEMGGVGLFGAGVQRLANAIPGVLNSTVTSANRRAANFEQAGVRPILAATHGAGDGTAAVTAPSNGAPMTMAIAGNPFGGNVRRNLRNSASDVATRAEAIASQYGARSQPENVGEAAQRAVSRFARGDRASSRYRTPTAAEAQQFRLQPGSGHVIDTVTGRPVRPESISVRGWPWRDKASTLEESAIAAIVRDEAGHIAGQTGVSAQPTNTLRTLQGIRSRYTGPASAEARRNPFIEQMATALEQDASSGALRFTDLRNWRTDVRRMRSDPDMLTSIGEAELGRIEYALTQDIYAAAREIGGDSALHRLRRADQFYRAGAQRIEQALRALDPERRGALNGAAAYDRIISLAREGTRQNSRELQSVRNSLPDDLWRELQATTVDRLGRVRRGSPAAMEPDAFSIENFVSNYSALSPEGRRILFGGAGRETLVADLNRLVTVAGYLKQVRGFANTSNTATHGQYIGTLTAAGGAVTALATGSFLPLMLFVGGAGALRLTGHMLTNPQFVRLLTSASKQPGQGGLRRFAIEVARLAERDPALAPLAVELSQRGLVANDNRQARRPQTAAANR